MTLGQRVCVLRDGKLQQVDTPQALYNSPVNLFVAGFIGSPAMNFVAAQLVRDGGPAVAFAGHKLAITEKLLQSRPGLEVTLAGTSSWASGHLISRMRSSPMPAGRGCRSRPA